MIDPPSVLLFGALTARVKRATPPATSSSPVYKQLLEVWAPEAPYRARTSSSALSVGPASPRPNTGFGPLVVQGNDTFAIRPRTCCVSLPLPPPQLPNWRSRGATSSSTIRDGVSRPVPTPETSNRPYVMRRRANEQMAPPPSLTLPRAGAAPYYPRPLLVAPPLTHTPKSHHTPTAHGPLRVLTSRRGNPLPERTHPGLRTIATLQPRARGRCPHNNAAATTPSLRGTSPPGVFPLCRTQPSDWDGVASLLCAVPRPAPLPDRGGPPGSLFGAPAFPSVQASTQCSPSLVGQKPRVLGYRG